MAELTTDTRPTHRYLETHDGLPNGLRITRWHPGARRRGVFRVMDDGGFVELGSVIHVGARLFMVYPAAADAQAFATTSYADGARALDERYRVVTLTLHTVQARLDTVSDPAAAVTAIDEGE